MSDGSALDGVPNANQLISIIPSSKTLDYQKDKGQTCFMTRLGMRRTFTILSHITMHIFGWRKS
jgi:hypothetical protein